MGASMVGAGMVGGVTVGMVDNMVGCMMSVMAVSRWWVWWWG